MTIVVAAAAPDGIVLAADSRTTLTQGRRHRVASDHARKVFAPYDGIGIATFGVPMLRSRTISGLLDEFVATRVLRTPLFRRRPETLTGFSEALASYFTDILFDENPAVPPGVLGFLVAGYEGDGIGRVAEVLLPASKSRPAVTIHPVSTTEVGVLFRGRTAYIRRMLEGYDRDGMAKSGVVLAGDAERELQRLGYELNKSISVQDALDLATFIVRMTVDMERLTDGTYARPGGVPACGGSLQSLVVRPDATDWIVRPPLRPSAAGLGEGG